VCDVSLLYSLMCVIVSLLYSLMCFPLAVLPFALEIARLFGGFFLSPAALPLYFSWIDAISYVKYVYMGLMINEFDGKPPVCTVVTPCLSGNAFLETLGIGYIPLYACALVLLGMIIVMRFITYIVLRIRP
jgi:ATP-binding cassette subfamily G (WHITE) protein 2